MTKIRGKGVTITLILSGAGLAFLLFAHAKAAEERLQARNPRTAVLKPASSPYIDAHVHIDQHDPEGAAQLLLQAMDGLNGAKAFILTEPYGPDNPARWDAEVILPAVKTPIRKRKSDHFPRMVTKSSSRGRLFPFGVTV